MISVVLTRNVLNEHLSSREIETPYRSCDITVMLNQCYMSWHSHINVVTNGKFVWSHLPYTFLALKQFL